MLHPTSPPRLRAWVVALALAVGLVGCVEERSTSAPDGPQRANTGAQSVPNNGLDASSGFGLGQGGGLGNGLGEPGGLGNGLGDGIGGIGSGGDDIDVDVDIDDSDRFEAGCTNACNAVESCGFIEEDDVDKCVRDCTRDDNPSAFIDCVVGEQCQDLDEC